MTNENLLQFQSQGPKAKSYRTTAIPTHSFRAGHGDRGRPTHTPEVVTLWPFEEKVCRPCSELCGGSIFGEQTMSVFIVKC